MSKENIFNQFPKMSEVEWQQLVAASLENVDLNKRLLKETYEGFILKPIYHKENLNPLSTLTGYPGAFPFIRGAQTTGNIVSGWKLSQSYQNSDYKLVNSLIKDDLLHGVEHFNLYFDKNGIEGIKVVDEVSLEQLFEDINLNEISLGFHSRENVLLNSSYFLHYFKKKNIDIKKTKILFNADPYQIWAKVGELPFSVERTLSHMAEVALSVHEIAPQSRAIGISSSCYHNAGSNMIQELSYSLATFVDYLEALLKAGLKLEDALKQFVFSLSVDTQFFMNIAKVRAFRLLFARVVEEYGGDRELQKPIIYCRSSVRMMSMYDPWTNIMRTTLSSFAAAAADVDYIESFLFDRISRQNYDESSPEHFSLGRRLSRNIQHILRKESHISRVIDPAGGSWYTEEMTTTLALKSWENFQEIQKMGGMSQALKSNFVSQQVKQVSDKRKEKIRARTQNITGVSNYSNPQEKLFSKWNLRKENASHIDTKNQDSELIAQIVKKSREYTPFDFKKGKNLSDILMDTYAKGLTLEIATQTLHSQSEKEKIAPLEAHRDAADFEALRIETEQNANYSSLNMVVIALGDYAALSRKVVYCKNIFDILGIEVIDPEISFLQVSDLDNFLSHQKFSHATVCFNMEELESKKDFFEYLKSKQCFFYVAGKMNEEQETKARKWGMIDNIYQGKNIHEVLKHYIGIESK